MEWSAHPPLIRGGGVSLNVLTLLINLYTNCYTFNYVVTPVEMDSKSCSACFISHAQDDLFAQVSDRIHLDARGG